MNHSTFKQIGIDNIGQDPNDPDLIDRLREVQLADVSDLRLFHGKANGGLEGDSFRPGVPTFFASCPDECFVYAEHTCDMLDLEIENAEITIFPVRVRLNNPCITTRETLEGFAAELGMSSEDVTKFCEDFEDSVTEPRNKMIAHIQSLGYDGMIMPTDLMPEYAQGDWRFQVSYVAFEPERQVIFSIAEGIESKPAPAPSIKMPRP